MKRHIITLPLSNSPCNTWCGNTSFHDQAVLKYEVSFWMLPFPDHKKQLSALGKLYINYLH